MVELVFIVEELPPGHAAIVQRRIAQERDVPARAEAAPLRMVDDHRAHFGIVPPFQQRGGHRVDHRQGQRMDRLGAIEREEPGGAFAPDDNVVSPGNIGHWRSRSRPTIMRMIWFVPSRIE